MSDWGKTTDDFYAEWKRQHGYETAKAEQWKTDLHIGQKVRAAQDIEWNETSSRYVPFGTVGTVVEIGSQSNEWGVLFQGFRRVWFVVYEPSATPDLVDGWYWETEIVPVDDPEPTPTPDSYEEKLI